MYKIYYNTASLLPVLSWILYGLPIINNIFAACSGYLLKGTYLHYVQSTNLHL